MIGHVSLIQDVATLGAFERAFERRGLVLDVCKELGFDTKNWVKFRIVQMSKQVMDSLDYASKLSRAPEHVHRLMEDGAEQARKLPASLSEPAHTCAQAGRLLTGQRLLSGEN
jgi:hypothetical protein